VRARVIKLTFNNTEVIGDPYPDQHEKMGTGNDVTYLSEIGVLGGQGYHMVADFRLRCVFCQKIEMTPARDKFNQPVPRKDEDGKQILTRPYFAVPFEVCRYLQFAEMPPYDAPPPQGQQQKGPRR
jgi:hypothetical protein